MTEEDTFNRLKKTDFEELRKLISEKNLSVTEQFFQKHGWTSREYLLILLDF